MNFPKLIDDTGKILSRVKTVAILALVVLLIITFVNNGCNRSYLEKMVEKVTGLNVRNDILLEDIKAKDRLLLAQTDSIKKLKTEIMQSEQKVNVLNDKYGQIKRKYDGLASDLLKIPVEDSYAFLDTVAYPYGGVKKFPFSEPQVKAIHRTYLEHESLIALNDNLQAQKDELGNQIKLHNKLNLDNEVAMMIMEDTRTDLEQINKNQKVIIAEQEKQLKRAKRKALFGKIGVGVGALIIGFIAGS